MDETAAATLFACIDREVWLVTSAADGRRGGLIATTIDPVSIVPEMPRMAVALAKQHHTCEVVEAGRHFALHLLGADNLDLVWRFGLESGRDRDKFAGLDVTDSPSGCPLVEGVIGWLDCRVETSLDVGDRNIYVAEVVEGRVVNFAPPLMASRLMERASPAQLSRLQHDRQHDAHRDAEAILAWRAARGL